jgi:hypothetical protein
MANPVPNDVIVPKIDTEQLTQSILNGNGVFDELMKSMNAQILEQYASERITADNYGTVYLGALQAVLAQSVQFLLTKDKAAYDAALSLTQVKKGIEEIDLVKAQIALTEAQTDKVRQEIAVSIDQQTLIPFQRDKLSQEILLLAGQVRKIDKENELIDQQILKAVQEVLVLEQQVLQSIAEVAKTEKEVELITQQILNAQEQVAKTQAEVALLQQRVITERAQTEDGAQGIVGAQTLLYQAQTKGFADDAIRKGVKAANDVFAIAKSNDPDAVADPTNMLSTLEYFLGVMQTTQENS